MQSVVLDNQGHRIAPDGRGADVPYADQHDGRQHRRRDRGRVARPHADVPARHRDHSEEFVTHHSTARRLSTAAHPITTTASTRPAESALSASAPTSLPTSIAQRLAGASNTSLIVPDSYSRAAPVPAWSSPPTSRLITTMLTDRYWM